MPSLVLIVFERLDVGREHSARSVAISRSAIAPYQGSGPRAFFTRPSFSYRLVRPAIDRYRSFPDGPECFWEIRRVRLKRIAHRSQYPNAMIENGKTSRHVPFQPISRARGSNGRMFFKCLPMVVKIRCINTVNGLEIR